LPDANAKLSDACAPLSDAYQNLHYAWPTAADASPNSSRPVHLSTWAQVVHGNLGCLYVHIVLDTQPAPPLTQRVPI